MFKVILALVMLVHGLIHGMGFAKAFGLAELEALTRPIGRAVGVLWLLAGLLFVASAVLLFAQRSTWWMPAAAALVISQVCIVMSWSDAWYGTLVNVALLVPIVMGVGQWRAQGIVERELGELLPAQRPAPAVVTDDDLARVPALVARWLERAGVVGGPRCSTLHLRQRGRMRTRADGAWMPFEAEQSFAIDAPGFLWVADVRAAPGVHLHGRDRLSHGRGHMRIELLSVVPVVDSAGAAIDQGAKVRFLAEMVWFPSAALHDAITWEPLDAHRARATLHGDGDPVSGTFTWNADGDVVAFEASRYYERKGGATLETWHIDVDPDSVRAFGQVRVPARSRVRWRLDSGDFEWLELEIVALERNVARGDVGRRT